MAVTKLWSVTERLGQVIDYATNPEKTSANIKREFSPEQYQALADVIAYAKDEEKTEREFYVEGINCNVAIARDQFITVKEQYQKTDGIQAYHGYLSFKETDISPEMAQKIGMEFANEVWGKRFQVVVTTHLNTKHLHCHFVINSISFVDGKHLWGEEKAWFKFRKVADRICEKYGLYYDPNPNRSKQSDYLTMKEKAGMPTRYSVAKEAIDYAIDHSKTLKEFQFALKEMGYAYNLSPSRKYWTVIPKGYDKPIRLKNLGADYTNDRIVERIKENRDRWAEIEPFQRATYKPRQYRMQTRGQKLKKKGGLYGLYLYYCYRLGYLPKYKKQNNARLHYLLKDDLMKLDKITDEVRLLGRENISTDEQLFSYKTSLEEQMKNLIAGRTHLRKKIRTNIDDGQLQAAKDEIASINGELKKLRREVKLCEDIAERSKVMEENLEHIETEISELVGEDNIYIFGESSEKVIEHYEKADYCSRDIYENDKHIKECVDFIVSEKMLALGHKENLERLHHELISKDWFMTLLDFNDYVEKKDQALADYADRKTWAKKMLVNIAKAGFFSSDRTIEQYNNDIWHLTPAK